MTEKKGVAAIGMAMGLAAAAAVWKVAAPSAQRRMRAKRFKKAAARTLESMGAVVSELTDRAF